MANEIPTEEENKIADARAKQPWVRYDSVVIGPGARDIGDGWFNNWSEFANADSHIFNDGARTRSVGEAYCNQSGTTEDWYQKVLETRIEFFAPPGLFGFEDNILDAGVMQTFFVQELSRRMSASVQLSDTDQYLLVPPIMLPANLGVENTVVGLGGLPASVAGHTGQADFRTGWRWPQGLKIPAKSKLSVTLQLSRQLRELLAALADGPGFAQIPNIGPNGEIRFQPYRNWYVIRVSHWGPRFVQLRGALSA